LEKCLQPEIWVGLGLCGDLIWKIEPNYPFEHMIFGVKENGKDN